MHEVCLASGFFCDQEWLGKDRRCDCCVEYPSFFCVTVLDEEG